jgi:hypothetical protein
VDELLMLGAHERALLEQIKALNFVTEKESVSVDLLVTRRHPSSRATTSGGRWISGQTLAELPPSDASEKCAQDYYEKRTGDDLLKRNLTDPSNRGSFCRSSEVL